MSRRSNNDDELETINSTFGTITVFKKKSVDKNEAKQRKIIEKTAEVTKNELNLNEYKEIKEENDPNENFFGIKEEDTNKIKINLNDIESNSTTESSKSDLNFIDKSFNFDKLEENSTTQSNSKRIINNVEMPNDFSYIDEVYFKKHETTITNKNENMKNQSFSDAKDLNWVDEMMLKPQDTQETNLDSVGSIREFKGFKKPKPNPNKILIEEKKSTLTDAQIVALKSIRNTKIEKKSTKTPTIINDGSQHKIIADEVPKWYKLTMDEAANILIKHICHFNVEHGILAIDKPYGLPSIGGPGVHLSVAKLMPIVKKILNIDYEMFMMHRLDEATTGVMLFALNKETELKVRQLFNERKVIKQYLAITKNVPYPSDGEINIPLIVRKINDIEKTYLSPNYNEVTKLVLDKPKHDNKDRHNAITKYRVLDSTQSCALVECQPLTGIKHQIRVHLSHGLNCPILGDHKYSHHIKLAPQKLPIEMLNNLKLRQSKVRYVPMHLHAYRIILPEYINNAKSLFINAKLPLHFINNLKRLKLRFI